VDAAGVGPRTAEEAVMVGVEENEGSEVAEADGRGVVLILTVEEGVTTEDGMVEILVGEVMVLDVPIATTAEAAAAVVADADLIATLGSGQDHRRAANRGINLQC
jgi:hypothetical protein